MAQCAPGLPDVGRPEEWVLNVDPASKSNEKNSASSLTKNGREAAATH